MNSIFGTCPRVKCHQQSVLPVGTSDELRVSRVKTYCPKCEQLYATKATYSDIDGAYFGTSFPHVFCLTYPELIPLNRPEPYIPRLFGFKIKQPPGLIARTLEQAEKVQSDVFLFLIASAIKREKVATNRSLATRQVEEEWMKKNGHALEDIAEFRDVPK